MTDDEFDALFSTPDSGAAPKRDPWEEFALEKVQAQLIDDEFYFDDQNRGFTAYAIFALIAVAVSIARAAYGDKPMSVWDIIFLLGATLIFICCVTLRIYGSLLAKRVERRQKWLERNGLRFL